MSLENLRNIFILTLSANKKFISQNKVLAWTLSTRVLLWSNFFHFYVVFGNDFVK